MEAWEDDHYKCTHFTINVIKKWDEMDMFFISLRNGNGSNKLSTKRLWPSNPVNEENQCSNVLDKKMQNSVVFIVMN